MVGKTEVMERSLGFRILAYVCASHTNYLKYFPDLFGCLCESGWTLFAFFIFTTLFLKVYVKKTRLVHLHSLAALLIPTFPYWIKQHLESQKNCIFKCVVTDWRRLSARCQPYAIGAAAPQKSYPLLAVKHSTSRGWWCLIFMLLMGFIFLFVGFMVQFYQFSVFCSALTGISLLSLP